MLTGIFIYTLPKLDPKEPDLQEQLFAACLQADIQQLYGCSTIPDLFGKIENFRFHHREKEHQLLAIIPADENLAALLKQVWPEIKFIFWSRELASDEVFNRWHPMSAGRYHDQNDLDDFIRIILSLLAE